MKHWNLSFSGPCSEDPAEESRRTREIYEKLLYPKMKPHQRLLLVPALFADAELDSNRSGSLAQQDAFMVAKLHHYRQWMIDDHRIAGLWGWHWGMEPIKTTLNSGFTIGTSQLPKTIAFLQSMAKEAKPTLPDGAAGHKRAKADDREMPAPARRLRASGSNTKEPSRSFALDPTGVITFTWSSEHTERGAAQASFHIVVRDAITGRVAYDSGRVRSAFPRHHLPANAQASLETAREHSWSVVWWDAEGRGSPQSTGTFHLGPGADEWAAAPWIGSNVTNLYRTNQLPATEEAAASVMLYVCALGFGSVSVNGEPALQGARMTVSGWTNNERLNLYESYDLTAAARNCSARNTELVIGIALGHGWRAPIFARDDNSSKPGDTTQRVFRALLVVTNRDGTSINVLSGAENWVGARGPVISDSVYDGETYDARLALPGWDAQSSLAFASRRERWSAAAVVHDAPRGRMLAQTMPAVVLDRVLTPQSITQPRRGVFVVDFGENVAGYASLRNVHGERGRAIVLHYAEILQHRGLPDVGASYDEKMPYFQNLRSANATDTFILAGTGAEAYVPSFTYHGARYVQVDGFPGTLTADNIEFHHFHSGNAPRSSLAFPGSPTLEAIQEMALGTQRSNMMSLATDCDQRDERLGWMGDEDLSVHTMLLNWQADEFFSVFMANMASEMDADGSLPDVVPAMRFAARPGDDSWTSAFIETAYQLFRSAGNTALVRKYWPQIKLHLRRLAAAAEADASSWPPTLYGDWVPPSFPPGAHKQCNPSNRPDCVFPLARPFTSAYSWLSNLQRAAEMATAIGDGATAAEIRSNLTKLTARFNTEWLHANGTYDSGIQTTFALPLQLGIVPNSSRAAVAKSFLSSVQEARLHFTTGDIGAKAFFPALSSIGRDDVAVAVLERTDYPSFGFMRYNTLEPATSNMWELLDSPFQGHAMNSRNHHMWSAVSAYLIESVAGLSQRSSSGFAEVIMAPGAMPGSGGGGVAAAAASLSLSHGNVSLSWQWKGGDICGTAADGAELVLQCGGGGGVITDVRHVSYGTPEGLCGSFEAGECDHPAALRAISSLCVGRNACAVRVGAAELGATAESCAPFGHAQRLHVQAACSEPAAIEVNARVPIGSVAALELPVAAHHTALVLDAHEQLWQRRNFVAGGLPKGVQHVRVEGKTLSVRLGSGGYSFCLS